MSHGRESPKSETTAADSSQAPNASGGREIVRDGPVMHGRNTSQQFAQDASGAAGQESGQETSRGKPKKWKNKRGVTSMAMSQTEAAQVHQQTAGARDEAHGLGSKPSDAATGGESQTRSLAPPDAPTQPSSVATAATSVAKGHQEQQEPQGQQGQQLNGSKSPVKHAHALSEGRHDDGRAGPSTALAGTRHEYRASAGGSLRLPRRHRNRPHAVEASGTSAGTASSSGTSSNKSDGASARSGRQRPTPGETVIICLNPRAEMFVLAAHAAAETQRGAASRGDGGSPARPTATSSETRQTTSEEKAACATPPKTKGGSPKQDAAVEGHGEKGGTGTAEKGSPKVKAEKRSPKVKVEETSPEKPETSLKTKAETRLKPKTEHTSPKAQSPKARSAAASPVSKASPTKTKNLDTHEWPTLPGLEARSRSSTMQSQSSAWGAKPRAGDSSAK